MAQTTPDPDLLLQLRAELQQAADPARAASMQAYMKSAMPYHGVPAVPMRAIFSRLFAPRHFDSAPRWREQVLALFRRAQFREERYAAVELSGHRLARPFQDLDTLPMYEEMIVCGAWWDYVDVLAAHRLGGLLRKEPQAVAQVMRAWSRSDDLWKRRSAILCQLQLKKDTDPALLADCLAPALPSREFFLRKAVGWALRQYARTAPQWVLDYVREHRAELSPLSQREALKHLAAPDCSS